MQDQTKDGRTIRLFIVIGDFNREELGIEIDLSRPLAGVVQAGEQIVG